MDSWDAVRVCAMECLELLPWPLPGYEAPEATQELVDAAFQFATSDDELQFETGGSWGSRD